MQTTAFTSGSVQLRETRRCASNVVRRARTVVVRAQQPQPSQGPTRREAALAALAAVAALASGPAPAHAIFGFGDGSEEYTALTSKIITDMTAALALDPADPARETAMKSLKDPAVQWVSRYRRADGFSGRPSFSNLYSAVNALLGQLNSFGYSAKIPAKRLERIQKELVDADKQLQRGR